MNADEIDAEARRETKGQNRDIANIARVKTHH